MEIQVDELYLTGMEDGTKYYVIQRNNDNIYVYVDESLDEVLYYSEYYMYEDHKILEIYNHSFQQYV